VKLMAITTVATVVLLAIFYKEFLVTSFDPAFGRTIGLPVRIVRKR
jgi:ABC-type Mn2+/Zn2+ transport system permease subunit